VDALVAALGERWFAMVEAAHIHPFSEAGDDDPRNGLALPLPGQPRMIPKRDVLEWRLEHLRDAGWMAPEATQLSW
jgi:hypothetical protein